MEFLSSTLTNTIPFLFILTILVFVHELGHFLVARRNGVKVEAFSIGFGPEIWGFNDKLGTRWKFSAIPLGGYVKMFGESDMMTGENDSDERPMTDEEKQGSFFHKRLSQRVAIVAAGPIANFIFAILVLWTLNAGFGVPQLLSNVGKVMENTAAEDAGLLAGDKILSIDGKPVSLFSEISEIVAVNADVPLVFEIQRLTTTLFITATPRPWRDAAADPATKSRGLLGIRPDIENTPTVRTGIVEGFFLGIEQTYAMSGAILAGVGEMFTGDRSAKELGGIILIAEVSGDAAQGGAAKVLQFLAILSINLGLINLFPIPVLDGGHLVFYAAEAIRGKPLSARLQEYGFRIGLFLVLLLMLFATWNDLVRLFER